MRKRTPRKGQQYKNQVNVNDRQYVGIGCIVGTDIITHIHVNSLLKLHGIDGGVSGGSRVYDISASEADAARAIQLLRKDTLKRRYWICIYERKFLEYPAVPEKEWEKRRINSAYQQVLQEPSYSESTALGSVLRSTEVQERALQLPVVTTIKFLQREYLDNKGKLNIGYDVVIELATEAIKRPSQKIRGIASLTFQVWNEGKNVEFRWVGASGVVA